MPWAGTRTYHSTTGSELTIFPGVTRKRSACMLLVIAAGMLSLNQVISVLPVALLSVIVSVSTVPSWPLSVHRRATTRPDPYRCEGKAYAAVGCGREADDPGRGAAAARDGQARDHQARDDGQDRDGRGQGQDHWP